MMLEIYPTAQYRQDSGYKLSIHIECDNQSISIIVSTCIEHYPQSLAEANNESGYLPLHYSLSTYFSSVDVTLMMIEKFPAALEHPNNSGELPLPLECKLQCRSAIIKSKCIEKHDELLAIAICQYIGYCTVGGSNIDVALRAKSEICWKIFQANFR
jgi:hypothetical protein